MSIHVCKQCGLRFEYCRACVFRPIRYKDAGFCSEECYEASKIKVVEPEIIEESVIVEEPVVIEELKVEEPEQVIEQIEVEVEAVAPAETTTPIIKKETNTYKKKKNKYQVHE